MKTVEKASKAERFNHWILALSFLVLLFTGLGFMFKSLSWLNNIFGGVHLASTIHEWGGVVFGISLLFSIGSYLSESLSFGPEDTEWIKNLGGYFKKAEIPPQGRLNAGQKIFYLLVLVFGLIISLTGLVMWLLSGSRLLVMISHLLHNISVVIFVVTVPIHIYFTTAANPGTFRIMTRGTVPLSWAKKRHGKWVKQMNLD